MAGTKVPVGESVRASVDFWKYSVPQTYGILGLVMLVNLAGWFMSSSPVAAVIIATPFGIMASGALMRLAFVDEHPGDASFRLGPSGLQWSRPEWRLLGGLGLLVFLGLLGLLALIMAIFIFGAAAVVTSGTQAVQANKPSPAAMATAQALAMVGLIVGTWVAVRVCLYPAATVATKKIQVFSTWSLTKGQFWHIFSAMILLNLPTLVLSTLATYVPVSLGLSPVFGLALSAVNAFVELPLLNGLYAYLYRGLRPTPAPLVVSEPVAGRGPWETR